MLNNIEKYRGIFVAFYACYNDSGNISFDKAAALAKWYEKKGIKGLYLNGSSGEGMLLSVAERNEVVDAVMDSVGGKMTVIVHVGANSTEDSRKLAAHARKRGCDAVSSVPNIYYPLPEHCIEAYWNDIMEEAQLPFIMYNIPSTTGYNLSLDMFERMIQKPLVAGIKTTSPDSSLIMKLKSIGGENTIIFHGEDAQLLAGLSMGATGGIGGTYGAMPELYLKIYRSFFEGKIEEAFLWQQRAVQAFMHGRVAWTHGIASMKAILAARGMDCGGVRAPFQTVLPSEKVISEAKDMIEGWK